MSVSVSQNHAKRNVRIVSDGTLEGTDVKGVDHAFEATVFLSASKPPWAHIKAYLFPVADKKEVLDVAVEGAGIEYWCVDCKSPVVTKAEYDALKKRLGADYDKVVAGPPCKTMVDATEIGDTYAKYRKPGA